VGPLAGVLTHVADERALVPEVGVAQAAGKLFPVHVHLRLQKNNFVFVLHRALILRQDSDLIVFICFSY
jgi:hypothetical protein